VATSSVTSLVAAVLVTTLCAACPHHGEIGGRLSAAPRRVDAHTESAPVTSLAVSPPWLLVGSASGLSRWDLRTGETLRAGAEQGWPGGGVRALTLSGDGANAWIATGGGLARWNVALGVVTLLTAPPPGLAGAVADLRALALDPAGGVWVGAKAGLFHADASGGWLGTGYTHPVGALWSDPGGDLYLGTETGLVVRHLDGSFSDVGKDAGCDLANVRFFVTAPDGTPVVVGDALDRRSSAIALRRADGHFASYRPSPAVRFSAGTRQLDSLVFASENRLYRLSSRAGGARNLRRDGSRLVPISGGPKSPFFVRLSDASLPPGVTALAASGDDLFAGTQAVGTARYPTGVTRPRWLRRADLVEGAQLLSVACASERDCYVATGGRRLWRWDGSGFTGVDLPGASRVLAAVRAPGGEVRALYVVGETPELHVARLAGRLFKPALVIPIDAPGALAGFSFARYSADGLLWVGLVYLDAEHEPRPYGVATIDLELGAVTYHRQGDPGAPRPRSHQHILPVPSDVNDVSFDRADSGDRLDVWFATSSGAAHLSLPSEKVALYGETEGLEHEILHGIAVSSGGLVYVATTRGVGTFDGERWSFPRVLALAAQAVAVSSDGRLWVATDRGVVIYDGRRTERVEARAGLLSEPIDRLQIDPYGRVWTMSGQGIGIITP
jgi:hypothetical protein